MAQITVIVKEPGKLPYAKRVHPTVHNFTKIVGGPIEVKREDGFAVIGNARATEDNCRLIGSWWHGTIAVAGDGILDIKDCPYSIENAVIVLPGLLEGIV